MGCFGQIRVSCDLLDVVGKCVDGYRSVTRVAGSALGRRLRSQQPASKSHSFPPVSLFRWFSAPFQPWPKDPWF